MLGRTLLSAVLTASLVITPAMTVWAAPSKQDIAAAQEAMKEGAAAEKKSDWSAARDAYQRAVDKNETPDARLHLARAEAKLGHLTEASDQYNVITETKVVPAPIKAAAKKELAAIKDRIPKITVKVPAGFSGTVRIDKVELTSANFGQPVEINPGTRNVMVEAEGYEPFKKTLIVADGANEVVDVTLVPVKKGPAEGEEVKVDTNDGSTRRTLGYISLGLGGAGLITGIAAGAASMSTRNQLKSSCTNNVCAESERDNYDKGKMQATISTVGWIVAGVGVGAGLVLLLTAPSKKKEAPKPEDEKTSITPYFGPGSLGVYGRF